MEQNRSMEYNLYHDIKVRTNGEIYIGVVGPVRTGKSTFIKHFLEELVLPNIEDEHERLRTQDEMPQSAAGKTITTTEPKFIPKEAVTISLAEDADMKVRLIDCVGYMVNGASGHMEEDMERMVKTPWYDEAIPFTMAAETGTRKVIKDHSTIGLVITTDGSFSDIERQSYIEAEERCIEELKSIGKPFLVLVNSEKPYSEEAKTVARSIMEKYRVPVMTQNCEQLKKENIHEILREVLYSFPITAIEFYMPKWVEMLPPEHKMKETVLTEIRQLTDSLESIRDCMENPIALENEYVTRTKTDCIGTADGIVRVTIDVNEDCYYEMLTEMTGETIQDEYMLMKFLKEVSDLKDEYSKVKEAMYSVKSRGYGVVIPKREEITLSEPEVTRHGSKFGVRMKAYCPSIHLIKADIESEISPIVGTEEQAKDLMAYIRDSGTGGDGIWETSIFGKTIEQLVSDGISGKIAMLNEESQEKLQETMQKIVNDANGGMVCIII